jgi:hypothetical protein
MKKYSILGILGIVLVFGLNAQTVSYDDAIKRIVWSIEDKVQGNAPVAIIKFDSSSKRFSDRIMNDLTETLLNDGVKVVERQNIEYVLQEQNFQLSGYVSDESMVSIGNMLGAQSIIIGSGENMADYYRIQFKMIAVETAETQIQISQNIRYDSAMRRLLDNNSSDGIGNTHVAVGAKLGAGFEINRAHSDMIGTGVTPKEESSIAFSASLFGIFRFNDQFGVQPEIHIMVNNGITATYADGGQVSATYTSLDIPLLFHYNFILSPVLVRVFVGPYLAIPVGKMNMEVSGFSGGTSAETKGVTGGIAGGFVVGYRAGPGHIIADIRYMNDFSEVGVNYKGIDMKGFLRRSVNITLGYELSL